MALFAQKRPYALFAPSKSPSSCVCFLFAYGAGNGLYGQLWADGLIDCTFTSGCFHSSDGAGELTCGPTLRNLNK